MKAPLQYRSTPAPSPALRREHQEVDHECQGRLGLADRDFDALSLGQPGGRLRRRQRQDDLAGRLESLRDGKRENVEILNKAAFSIFAFSNDERYGLAGHHTDEYMAALNNERTQMELLLEKPGVTLKLLLGPVRKYDMELQLVRFENLLEWLNSVRTRKNIEVRYTRNHGDNRLIVPGEFVLEGHKGSHETGYRFNTVCFLEHSIKDAIKLFGREWSLARLRNKDAISRIEELRDQILNGSAD